MTLRTMYCGVFGLLALLGMNCSSDSVNQSSQGDSENAVSGENMITLENVADLWQQYEASTNTTCVEALKTAIGESGLTGNPDPDGQIPCTGKCINASVVNSFGATGIWQVKCPESSWVLIYNAFKENGLIDETGHNLVGCQFPESEPQPHLPSRRFQSCFHNQGYQQHLFLVQPDTRPSIPVRA